MHLNSVHVYLKMLDFLFSCKNLNGTSVMICFLSITSIFIFTPILNERYYGMIDFNHFVIIDSFFLIYYPYYSKRLYMRLIHANIFFAESCKILIFIIILQSNILLFNVLFRTIATTTRHRLSTNVVIFICHSRTSYNNCSVC